MIGLELRRRIVEAYTSGRSGNYEETAELFGVGRATVNRLLRRYRATGDVKALPVGRFTPPYSPEFNPIEELWAKLKDIIRRVETKTRDAFDQAVASAMDQI